MKNLDQRNQIIEHSLKLNSTNLSPLRSGNISLRAEQDNIKGYLINYLKDAAIFPPSTVSTAPVDFFDIAR